MDIDTIEALYNAGAFEGLVTECPDCSGIGDEQYTCTTCWGQGGNIQIDVNEVIENLIEGIRDEI